MNLNAKVINETNRDLDRSVLENELNDKVSIVRKTMRVSRCLCHLERLRLVCSKGVSVVIRREMG